MERKVHKNSSSRNRLVFALLFISTLCLLLGRGWQFLEKSTPFGNFFFNPSYMDWVVHNIFQTTWTDYLNNPKWHGHLKTGTHILGYSFLGFSSLLFFIKKIPKKIISILLAFVFFVLLFLSYCYFISKGLRLGQFIEYSLQFCTPLFFLIFIQKYWEKDIYLSNTFIFFLKTATALTFIGHGLYAIGFHPVPGNFIDMMIKGFSVTESTARQLLFSVGFLDILCAVLIFFQGKKIAVPALIYIIIWGFLTALARIYTNFDMDMGWYSLEQWLPEFLMRICHFLLPFCLWINIDKTRF